MISAAMATMMISSIDVSSSWCDGAPLEVGSLVTDASVMLIEGEGSTVPLLLARLEEEISGCC